MGDQFAPVRWANGRRRLPALVGGSVRQQLQQQFRELLALAARHPRVRRRLRGCDGRDDQPRGGEELRDNRGDVADHTAYGTS